MTDRKACEGCRDGTGFDVPITMAFQPIVDVEARKPFAFEALVRGNNGQGAAEILSSVSATNRYAFDQKCRVTAIESAAELNLADTGAYVSINFLPNAVYEPRACIRTTLEAALRTGFPADKIIFEFTEVERLDAEHVLHILRTYRSLGFRTAIDDFGAGYSSFDLLCEFQPDIVKLDMNVIRGIDKSSVRQSVVRNTLNLLNDLDILAVCEGIETIGEYEALRDLGVRLMQGYLFAKPDISVLPEPEWPDADVPPVLSLKA
ncbi:MAG: EAL domain-containing protein [Pseudomonadota bacterium]